jgi:cytochrome c biogenesis protein CcmG, thiol:disulfide interchange protein DsbE
MSHRIVACLLSLLLLSGNGTVRATGLDLHAYRGKVVYLDFWASWCGPCRESFPWLAGLLRDYESRDLVVIGVNVDKDRTLAERFLGDTPAAFPIVYDPRGEIAAAYKIAGMPTAILIDRGGQVRYQHTGFSIKKRDEYAEHLRTLLSEAAP